MVEKLNRQQIQVLTYINPYLVDIGTARNADRLLFEEAWDNGFFVKNQDDQPYLIDNTDFKAGIVDLSNPDARSWYKEVIKTNLIGIGVRGWMADFGEGLPMDAKVSSGIDPIAYHHIFIEDWARLNHEVLRETGLESEVMFFMRAGYTKSPGYAKMFWLGDQSVTFGEHDGLKSAIKGTISSGLSGYSLNHSDIGGYTTMKPAVVSETVHDK